MAQPYPRRLGQAAMILYEAGDSPEVEGRELEVAGRRIAVRARPFAGDLASLSERFDPVERRFARSRSQGGVRAGPSDPEAWRAALARHPEGPALVGPCDPAEEIWGAFRAAAEGARLNGRAVYLLDPLPEGLPCAPGRVFVALFCWTPDLPVPAERIAATVAEGIASGLLLPLIPGWTAERDTLLRLVAGARSAGSAFVAPLLPAEEGGARRAIVETRGRLEPDSVEEFFGRVHHGDWRAELRDARRLLAEACAEAGLADVPPRPIGLSEPDGNAAAAGRLEERAHALAEDEHRASRLHAAARWIDESGRDLSRIAREGNFRKVFPFDAELAREAEEALTGRDS